MAENETECSNKERERDRWSDWNVPFFVSLGCVYVSVLTDTFLQKVAIDLVTAVDLIRSLKDFVADLFDKFGEFEARTQQL